MSTEKEKDYDALVLANWNYMSDLAREGFRVSALEAGLRDASVSAIAMPGTVQRAEQTAFGDYPNVDFGEIRKILKGAPDDLIYRVASALKPVDIKKHWNEGSLPYIQQKWARDQKKQLKALNKQYGVHLAWLQKQLEKRTLPLPPLVRAEINMSVVSLQDAVELSNAYIRFFGTTEARWKKDGKEYAKITTNPYWIKILKDVAALVDEVLADRNSYLLSDTGRYRLLADLLHLAYPWAWGRDAAALKLLRERI